MESNWIKVEDELPEEYKRVLFFTIEYGSKIDIGIYSTEFWIDETSHHIHKSHVTHWQPLPDKPAKE